MAKQIKDNSKFTGVRLPGGFKPVHYDLLLKPDLKKFTFTGTVKIDYESDSKSNEVILHAAELEITEGHVGTLPLSSVTYGEKTETAVLDFSDPIPTKGTMVLNFNGILNDKLIGFYRTEFNVGDTHIVAATTQFESTDARRCFPCWDEPAIKAEFTVSVVYPAFADDKQQYSNVALSNMPVVESSVIPEGNFVKFDKTPKMSTYLLAIIVGPFEKIEGSDGKRSISVYTVPGKKEQGRFALEVACKALTYYEQYFGVEYPLKKSDLIAIPDFASGAMENWGLVTYRETCLLVDPQGTSTARKQYIAIVVAHELAHQWFGNLVTMEWWTHLWLNEGFASFMEYQCANELYPEFDLMTQFVTDNLGGALELDALHNSHPIEVPVNHPSEILEIFDSISYNKGASVIRMMYNYIGDEKFRIGMKDYLNKFAYSNAITEDLWDALGKASGKPIRELMSGWTSQKGFPWLSVSLADETKQESNKLRLTICQSKFAVDGKLQPDEVDRKWQIPLSCLTGGAPTKTVDLGLFKDKQTEVSVELPSTNDWIKLNAGSIGYYRTAYSEELLKRLLPAILNQTLPNADRLGLQSDYSALCQAGCVSTVRLLELLEAYKNETEYTVWLSIDGSLAKLSTLLAGTDYHKHLQAFGRSLYSEIFKKVTWEPKAGENNNQSMLRGVVISRLVSFGDESVIEESKRRFKAHLDKKALVPADLRRAVYKSVAIHGGTEGFESLLNIYRTDPLHEEKNRVLVALGFIKDVGLLERAIKFVFSEEVKNQDKWMIFAGLGASNPGFAFKAFQDNKETLRTQLEGCHTLLRRIIESFVENFTSEERAKEMEKFFEENTFKSTERAIKQSIENIRANAQWLARDGQSVKSFLESK